VKLLRSTVERHSHCNSAQSDTQASIVRTAATPFASPMQAATTCNNIHSTPPATPPSHLLVVLPCAFVVSLQSSSQGQLQHPSKPVLLAAAAAA
jgi:hypothetical protein